MTTLHRPPGRSILPNYQWSRIERLISSSLTRQITTSRSRHHYALPRESISSTAPSLSSTNLACRRQRSSCLWPRSNTTQSVHKSRLRDLISNSPTIGTKVQHRSRLFNWKPRTSSCLLRSMGRITSHCIGRLRAPIAN